MDYRIIGTLGHWTIPSFDLSKKQTFALSVFRTLGDRIIYLVDHLVLQKFKSYKFWSLISQFSDRLEIWSCQYTTLKVLNLLIISVFDSLIIRFLNLFLLNHLIKWSFVHSINWWFNNFVFRSHGRLTVQTIELSIIREFGQLIIRWFNRLVIWPSEHLIMRSLN